MKNKVDKKTTMQVRIDIGLHNLLKDKAKAEKTSIKSLIEYGIAYVLEVKSAH